MVLPLRFAFMPFDAARGSCRTVLWGGQVLLGQVLLGHLEAGSRDTLAETSGYPPSLLWGQAAEGAGLLLAVLSR